MLSNVRVCNDTSQKSLSTLPTTRSASACPRGEPWYVRTRHVHRTNEVSKIEDNQRGPYMIHVDAKIRVRDMPTFDQCLDRVHSKYGRGKARDRVHVERPATPSSDLSVVSDTTLAVSLAICSQWPAVLARPIRPFASYALIHLVFAAPTCFPPRVGRSLSPRDTPPICLHLYALHCWFLALLSSQHCMRVHVSGRLRHPSVLGATGRYKAQTRQDREAGRPCCSSPTCSPGWPARSLSAAHLPSACCFSARTSSERLRSTLVFGTM